MYKEYVEQYKKHHLQMDVSTLSNRMKELKNVPILRISLDIPRG